MKKLLFLFSILLLTACGSSNVSGTYVCKNVKFSSQRYSPVKIVDMQQDAEENLIGEMLTVIQYEGTVWIGPSRTDGDHFKPVSKNEYVFIQDNGDRVVAKFFNNTLTVIEYDDRYTIEIICVKQ